MFKQPGVHIGRVITFPLKSLSPLLRFSPCHICCHYPEANLEGLQELICFQVFIETVILKKIKTYRLHTSLNNFWKCDASYTLYYVGYNTTKDATNMAGGPTNTTYGPTNATCGPTNTRGGSTCLLTQQVASPKPQVALLTQYLALPTQMVALLTQQVVWAAPQVALQIR